MRPSKPCNCIGILHIGSLDRELHVIESRGGKRIDFRERWTNTGCYQVGVEALPRTMGRNLFDISSGARLSTGEMNVEDAESRRFSQHAGPGCRIQFVGA